MAGSSNQIPTDIAPYFDDFDTDDAFHRILFRPSFPVQARELTQIQSMLQEQFKRIGTHLFKDGAMVIPGYITFDTRFDYVKVDSNVGGMSEASWRETFMHGRLIRSSISGLTAQVITSTEPDNNGHVKLYVKYVNQGSGGETVFSPNATLTAKNEGDTAPTFTGEDALVIANDSPLPGDVPTGTGTNAIVRDGIYFARGIFIQVKEQLLIVDEESDTPSARVGLDIVESIVIPEDDTQLNDNAQGSPNFGAPGAHRLKIELKLVKKDLGTEDEDSGNFIELLRLQNGIAQRIVQFTDYNILLDTLARRTFDESGDYTVRPWKIDVREYYNDGTNNGVYTQEDLEFDLSSEAEQFSIDTFGLNSPGESHSSPVNPGKFRPGKDPALFPNDEENLLNLMKAKYAVYLEAGKGFVKGFEILTIAKTLLVGDKARDFSFENNAAISTPLGNYVRVRNLHSIPDVKNFKELEMYDAPIDDTSLATRANPNGNKIGTCRVRSIEFHSGDDNASPLSFANPTSGTAVYRLYIYDIQTDPGKDFSLVKSFYHPSIAGSPGSKPFTCDVDNVIIPLEGQITLNGTTTATGDAGTRWFSKDSQRLAEDDWLFVVTTPATGAGEFVKVASDPTADNQLTLVSGITGHPIPTITNANFSLAVALLEDVGNNGLVYRLPQSLIRTIRDQNDLVDTNYLVRRFEAAKIADAAAGTSVTFTSGSNETFDSFSKSSYILFHSNGTVVPVTSSNFEVTGPNSIRFRDLSGLGVTASVDELAAIVTVRKNESAAKEKGKDLESNEIIHTTPGESQLREFFIRDFDGPTGTGGGTQNFYADIFKINKITMSADFTTAATSGDTDVTDRYILDNGQRDNFYGPGRLILKNTAPPPTGRLRIDFDYFSHELNKNYFSVDSYDIDYEDIPTYVSPNNGRVYNLRDCLDFRPRINVTNTGYDNVTGSLVEIVKGDFVTADYSFYLNRIDKVFVDRKGGFHILEGVSDILPVPPEDPTDGMVLYKLNVRAFTLDKDEIFVDFIENKRYTMRDIGKLEHRIDNLEYFTSLTLLEKETKDFEIRDEEGLNRFKNGFIVDPFRGHGIGDVLNPDYSVSIDASREELRPVFTIDNVSLIPVDASTPGAVNQGHLNSGSWKQTGDLFTLDYTDKVLVDQPLATNAINVNPFAVFNFLGSIQLDPPNDEWKEVETAPDLIVNHDGNFDAIQQLADTYGTVWNEWETEWSGVTDITVENLGEPIKEVNLDRAQHRDLEGNIDNPDWWNTDGGQTPRWPVRFTQIQRTTTTTSSLQTRRGIRANVVPRTVRENLGERTINISYIPFMRTRDVVFVGKGFKPETRLYTFFDQVDVTKQVVSLPQTHEIGDPVLAPPLVAGSPSALSPGTSIGDGGPTLVTDARGQCAGIFRIPNTDALRFKTGERIFLLTDRPNNDDNHSSYGATRYTASGLLETKQTTILSTRTADIVPEQIVEDRWISDTEVGVDVVQSPWVDPVAQSFLVDTEGGAFISKISVYFRNKDENIPVTCQIREMVNGFPGPRIIPFGQVTKDAADVVVNDIGEDAFGDPVITIDGVEQTGQPVDASTFQATEFVFPSPVYLQQSVEYCFVIMANSNEYEVWIATAGPGFAKVGTELPILDQPYAGVLFKSQNSSTWTEDQLADMMFQIYQCEFDTSTSGNIFFCNDDIQARPLPSNPLQFRDGSPYIRVNHRNHGHRSVASQITKVTISGVDADYFGVPASEINGTHQILPISSSPDNLDQFRPTLDSYVIKVTTPATIAGGGNSFGGGVGVRATENKPFETLHPVIAQMTFPGTSLTYGVKTTSGQAVHSIPLTAEPPQQIEDNFSNIPPNRNTEFFSPRSILSPINEDDDSITNVVGPSKSFWLQATFASQNPNVSPVIDVNRLSATVIGNRIDDPSYTGVNSINVISPDGGTTPGLDDLPLLSDVDATVPALGGVVDFDTTTNTISVTGNSSEASALSLCSEGKYLTATGTGTALDGLFFRVLSVEHDPNAGDATVTLGAELPIPAGGPFSPATGELILLNRYIDERSSTGGSNTSTYMTKRVVLAQSSTAIKINFGAYRSPNTIIDVYYKISLVDDRRNFDDIPWTFSACDFNTPPSQNPNQIRDYECTINNLPDFVSMSVKLVLRGGDPANPPRCQDLRAIALDA